jgi:hypothetical protein
MRNDASTRMAGAVRSTQELAKKRVLESVAKAIKALTGRAAHEEIKKEGKG